MICALEELPAAQRDVLVRLAHGLSPEDVAWSAARSPESLLEEAHGALRSTAPELADALAPEDRDRVADYVLGLQSPGQAAGTQALLEASRPARAWALWLTELLREDLRGAPPPIPGVRPRASAPAPRPAAARRSGALARRRERRRRRAEAAAQAELDAANAHYRPEALAHHRRGEEAVKLPSFVSRRHLLALWAALACLAGLIAFAVLTRVPAYLSAPAVVVAPARQDGPERVLALFPPEARAGLRPGARLRIELPSLPARVLRVRAVEPRVLAPREVVARFGLTGAAAAAVTGPSVAAAADLRPPRGVAARAFRGTAGDAKLRVGTERLISLVEL
jgi:hypothetical protein